MTKALDPPYTHSKAMERGIGNTCGIAAAAIEWSPDQLPSACVWKLSLRCYCFCVETYVSFNIPSVGKTYFLPLENIFPPVSKESRRFLNPLNLEKERERVCASSGPALQDPFSYPQHTAVLAGRRGLTEAFQSVENMSDRSRREVLMQQGPKERQRRSWFVDS